MCLCVCFSCSKLMLWPTSRLLLPLSVAMLAFSTLHLYRVTHFLSTALTLLVASCYLWPCLNHPDQTKTALACHCIGGSLTVIPPDLIMWLVVWHHDAEQGNGVSNRVTLSLFINIYSLELCVPYTWNHNGWPALGSACLFCLCVSLLLVVCACVSSLNSF